MRRILLLVSIVLALSVVYSQDIPRREALVGYWKLDQGEGIIAADSSGFGADGELIGGVDWVEGYIGNALEFDGIDGNVFMGIGDGQFDIEFEITLSLWVNQWDLGNGEHNPWLGKGDISYAIKHQSLNQYEFFVYTTTWNSVHAPLDSAHLFSWHHFAGTYDGFELKLYIDGVPADTVELDQLINVSEYPVTLATNSQETTRFFNGQLDEAMIFNVALTAEEIEQLYNLSCGVMQERTLVNQFSLQQNYPNPFNPVTSISYTIPAHLPVTLEVYDTLGKLVATVVDEHQTMGTHTATFDASSLPSGVYFYKLQAGDVLSEMKKMMLIK